MAENERAKVPHFHELTGVRIASVQHLADSQDAQTRFEEIGLSWPLENCTFAGSDPCVAWRSPTEKLLLSCRGEALAVALAELSPGKHDTLVATDLSEALSVHQLSGPQIDEWMAHLVDALSIPSHPGMCKRGRMADVAVFLIRLDAEKLWLVSDSTIKPYIKNWLEFSFEGAFSNASMRKRNSSVFAK
jgi:sarcosine oxidase gamma subunit